MDINYLTINKKLDEIQEVVDDCEQNITSINENMDTINSEIMALNEKCIIKEDFAILTGTFAPTTQTTTNVKISFPTGFNMNNCVPIAIAVNKNSSPNLSFGFNINSANYVACAGLNRVTLASDGITIYTSNPSRDWMMNQAVGTNDYSSSTTLAYKLVLMKIS